jgi:membrane protein
LRPQVRDFFEGNEQLVQAFDTLFVFVGETEFGNIGTAGFLFLIYTAIALVGAAASAFNRIWSVPHQRSVVRQVTDFVALIVLAPIGLTMAVSLVATATASSTALVDTVRRTLGLGMVVDALLRTGPLVVVFGGLGLVYYVLPNTRPRVSSVLLGALVATVLWYAALTLHVQFQMGVAKYSALYAGFAAFPIFLFWVYVSWMIVLLGALVAVTHQHGPMFEVRVRAAASDPTLREAVALEALGRICHDFLNGATGTPPRPATRRTLAAELEVPEQTVETVLDALVAAGFLMKLDDKQEPAYVLARAPDAMKVSAVLDAVLHQRIGPAEVVSFESRRSPIVREVLRGIEAELAGSKFNWTMEDLAARLGPRAAEPAPEPRQSRRPMGPIGRQAG